MADHGLFPIPDSLPAPIYLVTTIMSRTDGEQQRLLPYAEDVQQSFKSSWDQFADFALNDNVLEVAVGLMCVSHLQFCLRYSALLMIYQPCSGFYSGRKFLRQRHPHSANLPPSVPQPESGREICRTEEGKCWSKRELQYAEASEG